jgi:hypothetical protein
MDPEIVIFSLGTIVGSIIWFVRLEGKVSYHKEMSDTALTSLKLAIELAHTRIDETKEKHEEMESRILNEMGQIKVSLAEISGYMRKQAEK